MKTIINTKITVLTLVVICGTLPAFAQTNPADQGVSDRDQRQPGATGNPDNATNAVVVHSNQSLTSTNNQGVDDRDHRQNTASSINADPNQAAWQNSATNYQDRFGRLQKADDLFGMEVKNFQGQKLGKVKDLAMELKTGRVVEVILARGGFLGVDETLVAVPPYQFTRDDADNTLQLDADAAKLDAAPVFKFSSGSTIDPSQVSQVYQYYGAETNYHSTHSRQSNNNDTTNTNDVNLAAQNNQSGTGASNTPSSSNATNSWNQTGEIQRATKVMGLTVKNLQNQKVGEVENLIVDLRAGRLVEVILSSGGFMGIGGELSAVPPQSFNYGIHDDTLTLDRNQAELAGAPHFKSGDWSSVTNREQVEGIYRAYQVAPYFDTNRVDNTAQNAQDRSDRSLTPLNQGSSPSDVKTTQQIRRQIVAANNLSVYAHNVKIITIDGKVTLRGPVNSEEEKRQIGEIAASVASASNVTNQLQVRNTSTTSSAY